MMVPRVQAEHKEMQSNSVDDESVSQDHNARVLARSGKKEVLRVGATLVFRLIQSADLN